jgi:hypothetical protein
MFAIKKKTMKKCQKYVLLTEDCFEAIYLFSCKCCREKVGYVQAPCKKSFYPLLVAIFNNKNN